MSQALCSTQRTAYPPRIPASERRGGGRGAVGPAPIPPFNPILTVTTDQRGYPRPMGIACDAGAYEHGFRLFLPFVARP
jgi:hypothetical protein